MNDWPTTLKKFNFEKSEVDMVFLDEMKLLDVKPKKKKIIKRTKQTAYCADNLELDLNVDGLEPDRL